MRQEKNGDSHKSLGVYLHGNAESGNVHVSELLLAEIIARRNRDLSALSCSLGDRGPVRGSLWAIRRVSGLHHHTQCLWPGTLRILCD